jgi:hypothetical protein
VRSTARRAAPEIRTARGNLSLALQPPRKKLIISTLKQTTEEATGLAGLVDGEHRIDAGSSATGRIGVRRRAYLPHLIGKIHPIERAFEQLVKTARAGLRQSVAHHPELLWHLSLSAWLEHLASLSSYLASEQVFKQPS